MPLIGREDATRFEVRNLVSRFLRIHELLVLNLLEDKSINAEELKRLSELLQDGAESR